jgi:hypothetical protein
MSKSSYVPVRFVGGPMGGTTREYRGEPKPTWTPKDGALNGSYTFEWDREDGAGDAKGAKLRSGVYTWDANAEAAPADGDAASALMEELGPDAAAERLNSSGSSAVLSSGEGTDDRKNQETGDNASAQASKAEDKAKDKVAAQADAKDSGTSSGYDADESGANTKRPTSSASKGASTKPSTSTK